MSIHIFGSKIVLHMIPRPYLVVRCHQGDMQFFAFFRFTGLWSHKSWKIGGSEGRPFVVKGKDERDTVKELPVFLVADATSGYGPMKA